MAKEFHTCGTIRTVWVDISIDPFFSFDGGGLVSCVVGTDGKRDLSKQNEGPVKTLLNGKRSK